MTIAPNICYLDLEVHPQSKKILEYGAVLQEEEYRGAGAERFLQLANRADTLCGHNIVAHDLRILKEQGLGISLESKACIDTLYLSVLFFPQRPYHRLVKGYQLDGLELNNPLADARLTKELLLDSVEAYRSLPMALKSIYYHLLKDRRGFDGFFRYVSTEGLTIFGEENEFLLHWQKHYATKYCGASDLLTFARHNPIELAFALALISVEDSESLLPEWIKHEFPQTLVILDRLRVFCPGDQNCPYCQQLSPRKGLKRFFGFDYFRHFDGDGEKPLQEEVVEAALANKSLLAIFPTGGGKSLTFQLPALMRGAANRALTVIISPLQSLMKDQVDVLRNRHDINTAVTINGMLSPLERQEALERVMEGGANLLYISPESLRSNSINRLFLRRRIDRFVIDEAHCFSSWGQDFRVDYLYIGKFLSKLQEQKGLPEPIPVSCFTATAKPAVVEDIRQYFREHLNVELQLFQTGAKRKNLHYYVLKVEDKEEKYEKLKELLQSEAGPKIVYVSRVKRAEGLAQQLAQQAGIKVKAYHGQLERDEKIRIQNAFMSEENDLEVIVATSAFGMGVDKDNVKMVVHYNISDSLENYMQESGRAGRSKDIQAKCYALFDEKDLDAHFQLLNMTKLSFKEIYQIWQGIKKFRRQKFTKSALEIAVKAGWDTEMRDLETRVKVAIATLEQAGYVEREENAPRIFAQSILVKNVEEAQAQMERHRHHFIGENQYQDAKRIFSSLISRARMEGGDTRVDSLAENLAMHKSDVTSILNIFKNIDILSNDKDLTAYYFTVQGKRNSANVLKRVSKIEQTMFEWIFPHEKVQRKDIFLRELNELLNEKGVECSLIDIRGILNYWTEVNYIRKERIDRPNNQYRIQRHIAYERFKESLELRLEVAAYCLRVCQQNYLPHAKADPNYSDKKLMAFSVVDLKRDTELLNKQEQPLRFYEFILLYFHHLQVLELKDGLMVYYNPMKILRKVEKNTKRYTKEDYKRMEQYYESKTEQIHIVGEYARKQLASNIAALQFVEDYFTIPYDRFLDKYFRKRKGKIRRPISEEKFRQIMDTLSGEQSAVILDKKNDSILVAAGPGSGKTRVLVHKVASLLLMEDIKPEQFLMLTFSRPAALEFKTRLKELVGGLALQIDIFTYHGFAFQLMARRGDVERSQQILPQVVAAIQEEEISLDRIQNKSVIVIDEYQDVSEEEYQFILAIIDCAENIRVIAAGDDDQNIYEFRGSNVKYMRAFVEQQQAKVYYLAKNYRARHNLLTFTNLFLKSQLSPQRLKNNITLYAHKQQNGQIEIIDYDSSHLILPLMEHLKNKHLPGTTAVLTFSNEEAILIASLLKERGIPASLIVEKKGFSLRSLLELKAFSYFIFRETKEEYGLIDEEKWEQEKNKLFRDFAASRNLDLVKRMLEDFEKAHPKKLKGAWKSFLQQARVEDFYHPDRDAVLVSTMHKSKGKEFDNVFVLLNNYPLHSEEKKRVLYVALTRAKDNLYIHTNNVSFDRTGVAKINYQVDSKAYPAPDTLILEGGMEDIHLGFASHDHRVYNIQRLNAGAPLFPNPDYPNILQDEGKNQVLKFSQAFEARLTKYLQNGYQWESASAKYIVLWYNKEADKAYRVVLPEVRLRLKK